MERVREAARYSWRFLRDVVEDSLNDRVTGLAAEMAFFGALSVFPGLLAFGTAITLLGALGVDTAAGVQDAVLTSLERVLTVEADGVLDASRSILERGNGDVLTIALVVALWSGSRGMDAIVEAVAIASNVEERRSWVRRRIIALGLLLATVVSLAVALSMLVAGPLLGGGRAVADALGFGPAFASAWNVLRLPAAGLALVTWVLIVLHATATLASVVARRSPGGGRRCRGGARRVGRPSHLSRHGGADEPGARRARRSPHPLALVVPAGPLALDRRRGGAAAPRAPHRRQPRRRGVTSGDGGADDGSLRVSTETAASSGESLDQCGHDFGSSGLIETHDRWRVRSSQHPGGGVFW